MQDTAVYCVVDILLDGALIHETSLLSFFHLPEYGHIRCRNIYEVIVHKNYFTSVIVFG